MAVVVHLYPEVAKAQMPETLDIHDECSQVPRSRGRPPTFSPRDRQQFAELLRIHGLRGAREVSTVPISIDTLLKIAREFNIALKKGRRPRQAA